jgi:hypothetical protein
LTNGLTVVRCDGTSRAYCRRKRNQGKCHIPAVICLARRRVDALYALIRDHRTWQPEAPAPMVAA